MAREESGPLGKRPFVDLDKLEEAVCLLENVDVVAAFSDPSLDPSSSMSKRRKTSANVDIPGHEFLVNSREIAISFYKTCPMALLRRQFMAFGKEGFQKLGDELSDKL